MTKIISTVGPILSNKDIGFIVKDSEIVRLNMSHNTFDWHKQKINLTNEFIEQRTKYFYKFDGKSGDRAADSIIQFFETMKSKSN